jgi:hypothetical protein
MPFEPELVPEVLLHWPLAPPLLVSARESGWGWLTVPEVPAVPDVACELALEADPDEAYAAAGP